MVESSPASPKTAPFEVKSLSILGRERNESQELCCFWLPPAYPSLAGGAHMVNINLQK